MTEGTPSATGQPVTVVVSRLVKPGRQAEYETWLRGITGAASEFPGHLGIEVIRPASPRHPEYTLIFRFASQAALARWEESAVRREWLERSSELTQSDATRRQVTGLEYWFTPAGVPVPARHKQALLTWLVLFPLLALLTLGTQPFLGDVPLLVRLVFTSATLVLLMTYVVMPYVTQRCAKWLFRTNG